MSAVRYRPEKGVASAIGKGCADTRKRCRLGHVLRFELGVSLVEVRHLGNGGRTLSFGAQLAFRLSFSPPSNTYISELILKQVVDEK